jgi:alpha-galactosidase
MAPTSSMSTLAGRAVSLALALSSAPRAAVRANDNGLALTPPMGWRSWNLYGSEVNQELIEGIMDGMVSKQRSVDGVPTSLCDLGYCDVGLDDNWQAFGAYDDGAGGTLSYHDASGAPVVNADRFPDFNAMTDHAHALGLKAGWYGNNCICSDGNTVDDKFYAGDVDALIGFGFDSYKLDGCGAQLDMDKWDELINASGKPIMVENCHWGSAVPYEPTADWCPWNFYRTSGDVRASYASVVGNLATAVAYSDRNLSYPGCWAYPDMLEVGVYDSDFNEPGLTTEETRSHFGAWAARRLVSTVRGSYGCLRGEDGAADGPGAPRCPLVSTGARGPSSHRRGSYSQL